MQNMENNKPIAGEYVLDSYAVLAFLENESGSGRITELLEAAVSHRCIISMCTVNLGEVLYIVERERGLQRAQETLARIDQLPVEIVDAGRALSLAAAHLKAKCPVAYADCFAAALSQVKDAALVTGDAEFQKIQADFSIRVEWLR